MRSSSSKVAGWFVPARGTCSRKLSSPSASIRQTCTPACAIASDRHSPTGPAPTTITRLEASMLARWVCRELGELPLPWGEGADRASLENVRGMLPLRGHDVLHGADPASVGEVEHDAERILVLGLVVGVRGGARSRRLWPAGEILAARAHDLLLRFVEIVHPHTEVVDADLLVAFLLEQRDVDGTVGDVEAAPSLTRHFHVEGVLEKLGGLFRIGNDERDVAKLGHDLCPS